MSLSNNNPPPPTSRGVIDVTPESGSAVVASTAEVPGLDVDFSGKQEGERVLHVIRPHYMRKVMRGLIAIVAFLTLLRFVYMFHATTKYDPTYVLTAGTICCLIFLVVSLWWVWFAAENSRSIVTDRRFIRIEASFPFFIKKRSLLWIDVAKAKGHAPNLLFRFMNVGWLSLQPRIAPLTEIDTYYVPFYEDVANYIDKIIYIATVEKDLEKLKAFRPFISRAKGKRY